MKKIYVLAAALFMGANVQSQQQIDFEGVTIPADSFINNAAVLGTPGSFDLSPVTFSNNYDSTWGAWSGFSFSNVNDTVTAGYTNQYASWAYTGADSSSNYAVFYSSGEVVIDNWFKFTSFEITNNTYAAISMRDGDMFAKKFGDTVNAAGVPDGTNGEDYFRVWIIGEDVSGAKDSIEFYLADYRFSDDSQDYILKDWTTVDLTTMNVDPYKLTFRFESSDVGQWGINTPMYFVMDNLKYELTGGVEDLELDFVVYPNPVKDVLTIKGGEGKFTLLDINGKVITAGKHKEITTIQTEGLYSGVFFLKVETDKGIVTKKIIK